MSQQVTAVSGKDSGRVNRIHLQLHNLTALSAEQLYRSTNPTPAEPETLRFFRNMVAYNGTNPFTPSKDPTAEENYFLNTNPTAKEIAMMNNGETPTRSFCEYA